MVLFSFLDSAIRVRIRNGRSSCGTILAQLRLTANLGRAVCVKAPKLTLILIVTRIPSRQTGSLLKKMRPLHENQLVYNLGSRHNWELFRGHRERMMTLIRSTHKAASGKIAILGAGNCNDIDLNELSARFEEVHLFDLDSESMEVGVSRQTPERAARIRLHQRDLAKGTPGKVFPGPIDDVVAEETEDRPRFDLVISTCLLSQLMETVGRLDLDHRSVEGLMHDVRDKHLHLMSEIVAPGGSGLIVTDVSSSSLIPDLSESSSEKDSYLMETAIRRGACFTGLNPRELSEALGRVADRSGGLYGKEISPPWRWQLDEVRSFLVYALGFTKP